MTTHSPGPPAPSTVGGGRLTALAVEVRRHAAGLGAAAAAAGWRSTAATACRSTLTGLGLDLLGAAALLDHAAAALEDHARTAARRASALEHTAVETVLAGVGGVLGQVLR